MDLINPRSKTDGSTPVVRETEHYFLDLPRFQRATARLSGRRTRTTGATTCCKFARNYVEDGLRGRPITRDIEWGIPVPLEGWEDKRLYVWFEAVMGYFTASIEWARNIGQPEAWKNWWYNPQAEIYNFIGKDNIPFHTIIWQAELLGVDGHLRRGGADGPISLPYDVPANEFMNIEGQQFTKSRNWAIWVPDILERYDPDAIRYYVAIGHAGNPRQRFAWADFVARNNDRTGRRLGQPGQPGAVLRLQALGRKGARSGRAARRWTRECWRRSMAASRAWAISWQAVQAARRAAARRCAGPRRSTATWTAPPGSA